MLYNTKALLSNNDLFHQLIESKLYTQEGTCLIYSFVTAVSVHYSQITVDQILVHNKTTTKLKQQGQIQIQLDL